VPEPVRPMPGEGAPRPRHRTGSPTAGDGDRRAFRGRQASGGAGARHRGNQDDARRDEGYWGQAQQDEGWREGGYREDGYRDRGRHSGRSGYRDDGYRDDGYRDGYSAAGYGTNGRRGGYPDTGHRGDGRRGDGRRDDGRRGGYSDNGYPGAGYRDNGWRDNGRRSGYADVGHPDAGYPETGYPETGYRGNGRRDDGRRGGYPETGYRSNGRHDDVRRSGYPGAGYPDAGYPDAGYRDDGWLGDGWRDPVTGASDPGNRAGDGNPWDARNRDDLTTGPDRPDRPDRYAEGGPDAAYGQVRGTRHGAWPRRRRRRRRRLRDRRGMLPVLAGLEVVVIAFVCVTGWSIGHALTMPGGGTFAERLAEWGRDHYLGPLITLGEYLTYTPPKAGGRPTAVPSFNAAAAAKAAALRHKPGSTASLAEFAPPKRLKSPAGKPLPGEGVWRVLASVNGKPAMFGTWLRPDPVHTSYVEGIVEMNPALLSFQLHPGVEDPGPGNWHSPPWIPPGHRRGLVATFNGGFKIASSDGGFYLNGTYDGSLVRGVASVVYYRDGHIAIGVWGYGGLHMSPDVVGVRQNLHLIIEHGHIPATVDQNVLGAWGATLGGAYYEWRSGIGVTRTGRIVFAYGPALDVRTLAGLLKRAGCVTAMQLDINPDWMSFMYYRPGHHPGDPTPFNLLQDQMQPPNRYYSLANRDFTAVYAR